MNRAVSILIVALAVTLMTVGQQPVLQPAPQRVQVQPSQKPSRNDEDDVVRITTNLVQVDAVITDKNGKPVTDLRADEVEILENGKPQNLTNFSFVALESVPASVAKPSPEDKTGPPLPPALLRPEQVRRTIAIVVDDLGLSFESTYYTRQALRKFIDQNTQPNDLVAIIRTGGGIGALQQFTTNKRQLYAAIERLKWNFRGRGGISAVEPIRDESANSALGEEPDENEEDSDELEQFREDVFAVGTLGALSSIVRGLKELPGRKSIVLVSDGLRIFSRNDPSRSDRVLQALRRFADLANRASVVVYTIDARGLQTLGITAADSIGSISPQGLQARISARSASFSETQEGLIFLAEQTGGLAIRNSNDLASGIRRAVDDQKGYYLIGYRPDPSSFDAVSGRRKFNKLSLKILRPGKFEVRMRNGFFGVPDEMAPKERVVTARQQLLGALTSPFSSSDVEVRLTSLFANDAQLGSVMRSFLHIKGGDLTFAAEPDGWHKAVFDIVAVTFGENGVPVDPVSHTHTIRVRGNAYETAVRDGFTYNLLVPIKKAGAYQLRMVLRDVPSGRLGSATQFIEVPDVKKNRLTMSGILMVAMPVETFKKRTASASSALGDGSEESENRSSSVLRRFRRGHVMEYSFLVYNAKIDKATKQPRLTTQVRLFRNGQQIFQGKELDYVPLSLTDPKRLVAGGAIQLGTEMELGEYVLQVIVRDKLVTGKHAISSQWMDFELTE
jgi:VWFA-related protein